MTPKPNSRATSASALTASSARAYKSGAAPPSRRTSSSKGRRASAKTTTSSPLGAIPQDKKYCGEDTTLEIGDNNTIREFVTFNRGTVQDIGKTVLGDGNWIMAYVHLAHDCVIGNNTTFANNVILAGHVHIEDHVVMGGAAMVYQFVRIGAYTMVGYCAGVKQNVPPYSLVVESPARIAGINLEGLKRHHFSTDDIAAIKRCHHHLYRENLLLDEARDKINALASESEPARRIAEFLENTGKRGLIR